MGKPGSCDPLATGGDDRLYLSSQAHALVAGATGPTVIDELECSFPLLDDEAHWLMALLADDISEILTDD